MLFFEGAASKHLTLLRMLRILRLVRLTKLLRLDEYLEQLESYFEVSMQYVACSR